MANLEIKDIDETHIVLKIRGLSLGSTDGRYFFYPDPDWQVHLRLLEPLGKQVISQLMETERVEQIFVTENELEWRLLSDIPPTADLPGELQKLRQPLEFPTPEEPAWTFHLPLLELVNGIIEDYYFKNIA